ncbi:pentatricopeptide repeat-containing protein At3g22470, mitochondrial-like [Hevea brasiliensis]|uniref:pentatricopeptide repeat-containing protein At3g22470, mitochondrial-like n=1 Tax=Hevea brasiliensis TaxID=3981 RepID=UPI0025CBE09E|nr:pentatricopeptide repeat-containing protein At3g22470, mitochondrial-like [Hevea brasiliensis]
MEKGKLEPELVFHNISIDGMCKAGKINDAKELFSRFFENGSQHDVYTYGRIIKGLCKEGLLNEAYKVFRGMGERGCLSDDYCNNVIIQEFLKRKHVARASQFLDEMVGKGFSADATTTSTSIGQ